MKAARIEYHPKALGKAESDRLLAAEVVGDGPAESGIPPVFIEQEQVLTTHNLAVLLTELGLTLPLRPQLSELAKLCFK